MIINSKITHTFIHWCLLSCFSCHFSTGCRGRAPAQSDAFPGSQLIPHYLVESQTLGDKTTKRRLSEKSVLTSESWEPRPGSHRLVDPCAPCWCCSWLLEHVFIHCVYVWCVHVGTCGRVHVPVCMRVCACDLVVSFIRVFLWPGTDQVSKAV